MTPFHRLENNYIYYLVIPWFNPFVVIDVFRCRIDTKTCTRIAIKGFNHDTVLDINFLMLTRADFKYQNNKDCSGLHTTIMVLFIYKNKNRSKLLFVIFLFKRHT